MFILIESTTGVSYAVRKNDIKRVYETVTGTAVRFAVQKENTSIFVHGTVEEFYNKYLEKK